jgi:hypothetical protein
MPAGKRSGKKPASKPTPVRLKQPQPVRPAFNPVIAGAWWPWALVVVLFPVLVLWHRDNALFTPPWYADPWFYTGFFRNLTEYKGDLFFGLYYGGRLGWVLPGALCHALLPPLAANLLLRVLVHGTAACSLFFIVRRLAGTRAALPATLVFSMNPWVWAAIGWDYPDGAGIAYCLLALALLTRSAALPGCGWSLAAAGAALGALVYTHLFWASLAPVPLLYGFVLGWQWHRMPPLEWASRMVRWTGAGFLGLTAAFGSINYLLDGNFWFYSSSISQAVGMAQDFHFFRSVVDNGRLVAWMWPAVGGSLCALALLTLRVRNGSTQTPGALIAGLLLLPLGFMSWMQYRGNTVLGHYPYASDLLPFIFIVCGVMFWTSTESMSRRTYLMLCGGAALVFAALWYGPGASYFLVGSPSGQQAALWLTAFALGAAFCLRQRPAGAMLACAGFAGFTALSLAQTSYLGGVDLHGTRAEFQRIMRAQDRIEGLRGGHLVRFWFDRKEPGFFEFYGLNSLYLAEFSRINEQFPQGCNAPVPPDTLIVVASGRQDAGRTAQAALAQCWQPWGMSADLIAADRVNRPGQPYTLAYLRAKADPGRWRPVRAVFAGQSKGTLEMADTAGPLPVERWEARKGMARKVPGGIRLRTPAIGKATAAEYATLVPGFAGRYRFAVRCRDRSGLFAFQARHATAEDTIGIDNTGYTIGAEREMSFWLELRAGEEVVLRLRSNDLAGAGAASCLLGDLTVTAVPIESGDQLPAERSAAKLAP